MNSHYNLLTRLLDIKICLQSSSCLILLEKQDQTTSYPIHHQIVFQNLHIQTYLLELILPE